MRLTCACCALLARACADWDSYWVVLGLLAVGMHDTAASLTANLIDAVHAHGFVPNGLRTYYLGRSQPPMLTQMVCALLESLERMPPTAGDGSSQAGDSSSRESAPGACSSEPGHGERDGHGTAASAAAPNEAARSLLRDALPALDREYAWWMRGGPNGSAVELPSHDGRAAALLNRYSVVSAEPRAESWREDEAVAESTAGGSVRRSQLFGDLAAAAESGWDFSSRWLGARRAGEAPLAAIRTGHIMPVELNAILYRNEMALQRLHAHRAAQLAQEDEPAHGPSTRDDDDTPHAPASTAFHTAAADKYAAAAAARRLAMNEWMWHAESARWLDLLWDGTNASRLEAESAASYVPLWAGVADASQSAAAVGALARSSLVQRGGVATTLVASGQQWDWPNAWPPLQQMLIEGLSECGAPGGADLAADLASRWLASNHLGWQKSGVMHEKYDATRPGERGGGGEYEPQLGFGWTNGVALWLLERYAGTRVVDALDERRAE